MTGGRGSRKSPNLRDVNNDCPLRWSWHKTDLHKHSWACWTWPLPFSDSPHPDACPDDKVWSASCRRLWSPPHWQCEIREGSCSTHCPKVLPAKLTRMVKTSFNDCEWQGRIKPEVHLGQKILHSTLDLQPFCVSHRTSTLIKLYSGDLKSNH